MLLDSLLLHLRQIVLPRAHTAFECSSQQPQRGRSGYCTATPPAQMRTAPESGRQGNHCLPAGLRPPSHMRHDVVVGDGGGNWGAPIGPRLARQDRGGAGSWRVPRGAPLPWPPTWLGRVLSMAGARGRAVAPVPPHAAVVACCRGSVPHQDHPRSVRGPLQITARSW